MRLYVMRHGDALRPMTGPRFLSDKGVKQAEAAGLFLRRVREVPDMIVHSTLARSKQTAEFVARMADVGDCCLKKFEHIEPEDSPEEFIEAIMPEFGPSCESILVVGHDPFVSSLASLLLVNTRAAVSFRFDTGALFCAESTRSGIIWTPRLFLTSGQLALLAEG